MKNNILFITIFSLFVLTGCVQEEYLKTITFSIDMSKVEVVNNVGIKGDFTDQRWREFIPLTDEDGYGIYTVTLSQKTAVYGIEFKFVNQNNQYELEDQANREIIFEYQPETIEYFAVFNNNKDIKIKRK